MRVGRQKKITKDLRKYKLVFGLNEPYRVLMDPTFIHVALESKLQIREQLVKLLGSQKITPMVTSCGLAELERLRQKVGNEFKGAQMIAKQYYRIQCGHGCCPGGDGASENSSFPGSHGNNNGKGGNLNPNGVIKSTGKKGKKKSASDCIKDLLRIAMVDESSRLAIGTAGTLQPMMREHGGKLQEGSGRKGNKKKEGKEEGGAEKGEDEGEDVEMGEMGGGENAGDAEKEDDSNNAEKEESEEEDQDDEDSEKSGSESGSESDGGSDGGSESDGESEENESKKSNGESDDEDPGSDSESGDEVEMKDAASSSSSSNQKGEEKSHAKSKNNSKNNQTELSDRHTKWQANPRKWIVATMDTNLMKKLRQVPGIPLITLNGQVPRLESMSYATQNFQKDCNEEKQKLKSWEEQGLRVKKDLENREAVRIMLANKKSAQQRREQEQRQANSKANSKKQKNVSQSQNETEKKTDNGVKSHGGVYTLPKKPVHNHSKIKARANPLSCRKKQKKQNHNVQHQQQVQKSEGKEGKEGEDARGRGRNRGKKTRTRRNRGGNNEAENKVGGEE